MVDYDSAGRVDVDARTRTIFQKPYRPTRCTQNDSASMSLRPEVAIKRAIAAWSLRNCDGLSEEYRNGVGSRKAFAGLNTSANMRGIDYGLRSRCESQAS